MLVVSGPGSGKTRVLTYRVAFLIESGLAPEKIMAVTFTNKAAREMVNRLEKVVGKKVKKLWVGTFHSICLRILRKEAERLGYKKDFRVLDEEDSLRILKNVLLELNLDRGKDWLLDTAKAISLYKNKLILPADADNEITDIYQAYQDMLYKNSLMDFDDLLLNVVLLFQKNEDVLKRWQRKFKYILVDEYQDTNHVQYLLVKILSEKHRNLFVVGDPDQGIYGWRGADISNILSFEKDYPDALVIKMEQNYRSTKEIVHAANELMTYSSETIPKEIWTKNHHGEKIEVHELRDEAAEAVFIAKKIVTQGYNFKDVAILVRTHAASARIQQVLARAKIPYRVVSGVSFYGRKEVKDMLAYLRLIYNNDDDEAFLRIVNMPARGIGEKTVAKLAAVAKERGISLFKAIDYVELSKKNMESLKGFKKLIRSLKRVSFGADLVEAIYIRSGYLDMLRRDNEISRLENLVELQGIVDEHKGEKIEEFLDYVTLLSDSDFTECDAVKVMTCHAAKGLEFPVVFIAGLNDGILPHYLSLMEDNLEEERRLLYVAITRAMEKLYLTYTKFRYQAGRPTAAAPSRFLRELPEDGKLVAKGGV